MDVRDADPHVLMDQVAFVFQNNRLFKTSILENVRAARPEASRDEVLEALRAAQCEDILEKLRDGMDTVIGTEGTHEELVMAEGLYTRMWNIKHGTFWTVIVNLTVMGGMGILYLMMAEYMAVLTGGKALPKAGTFLFLVLAFLALSILTHLQQYRATYGLVYGEVKAVRLALAERMRKLPLGYFGKRDLADLTETVMGDVNRLEHVWSHCLGYLYGSYISTAIIAAGMLIYDWRMALACLWGVPVAFALLFGSRKLAKRNSEITKEAGVQVSDGIQETLESIREIRATNQEDRFLKDLNDKIDHHEKTMIRGELSVGIFINAASVIMRLGVATTILTGTRLILSGQIDFMVLFISLQRKVK